MATNVYLDIINASTLIIVFKLYDEFNFIENLNKNSIKLSINNNVINSFSLHEDNLNQKYTLTFSDDISIDHYDVILLYIDNLNYKSDIYVIYLQQIFYNGEAFNIIPDLPLDITDNAKLTISLLKANNKSIPLPPNSTYKFLSGIGSDSDIYLPSISSVNEDIDLSLLLKNLSNKNILDSDYIIDIEISKL